MQNDKWQDCELRSEGCERKPSQQISKRYRNILLNELRKPKKTSRTQSSSGDTNHPEG